ncbi:uncharacterized protein K460DRAFT_39287 [Cucurbitaria berberidis CBS 394.84]|uniref:Secreted protein n=1 Tax=Cucurbitaria berberidis CBS 394.84 TaxID=1168544 RepID=A0A9P4GUD2_9PLEO|nr:uncharacterized protein K460DRAFT_39287 [Cucurbitaria berberidis CBS 394.84]KAF1851684.1 hypothetical protein K460DRAFT_39287 [Cucurbitaria berberidis CBS 394.84]
MLFLLARAISVPVATSSSPPASCPVCVDDFSIAFHLFFSGCDMMRINNCITQSPRWATPHHWPNFSSPAHLAALLTS